jgi:hypothetical protein
VVAPAGFPMTKQNAPSKIHVVTRAYLARWAPAPERVLVRASVEYGDYKLRNPAAAGWVKDWWGSGDPALNEACEMACSPLEGHVPALLRDIDKRWPFPGDDVDRGILGQFMALHVLRTDGAKEFFAEARENSLGGMQAQWNASLPFERFADYMRSDGERARKLLAMVNKLASALSSMHWTLLRFQEPMLITSDQPVCPVPLLDEGENSPINPTPRGGWIDTIEVRFPLTPHHALLCSWHPWAESDRPVEGTWAHAVNLNAAVRDQAGRYWFHDPRRKPPLPSPIFIAGEPSLQPIVPEIIPGYSSGAARDSPLRSSVLTEIENLIERQEDSTMFVARPDLGPDAA